MKGPKINEKSPYSFFHENIVQRGNEENFFMINNSPIEKEQEIFCKKKTLILFHTVFFESQSTKKRHFCSR